MVHDIAVLDALDLRIIVDNETDGLSSVDEGLPQIGEVADRAARLPAHVYDGHECKVAFDQLCCACHGFSVLLSGRRGAETRSMLFDVGPYGDLWLANAERIEVDLAAIECIFLSHWHSDHSGGFPAVVAAVADARRRTGRPPVRVDLHPDRPDQRGVLMPTGTLVLLSEEPSFEAIEAAGGEIALEADAHRLCDGFFYGSGAIDRVTEFETGLVGHHSLRGGRAIPDPLIMDERFVAAQVKGRGVSVLSACSHAGIVNACLGAKVAFDNAPIDVALGGYHLAGKAMESRIGPTVRDLDARISPRVVAPGHCTGWRAKAELSRAFAPGRYAPSVVGSWYRLAAT
jgi:7,8-dihydropterin-6-yl-methyl-4-(beta-D-ribofuranosyl)aminobenzene 5'-phosphate synthase